MIRLFFSYGLILQIAALVHFVRRRPDMFWLWIILFGGGLGSLIYLVVEAAPDLKLRGSLNLFHHRSRRRELEYVVKENPAPANYEELGTLYAQEKRWAEARDCFDKAIAARADSLYPFYHRARSSFELEDYASATADLEKVVVAEPNHDFYRAALLLADCYARSGNSEKAGALLEQVTRRSSMTEAQLRYALFLAEQERTAEALEWIERLLAKRPTMPRFQRRAERNLFRQADSLRKKLLSGSTAQPARAR